MRFAYTSILALFLSSYAMAQDEEVWTFESFIEAESAQAGDLFGSAISADANRTAVAAVGTDMMTGVVSKIETYC